MNYINRKNFTEEKNLNNKSIFLNNNPFPHIVIDNFLNEGITEKMSDDFILDDEWINNSFVNNFNKYNLPSLEKKSFECKSIIKELNSESFLRQQQRPSSTFERGGGSGGVRCDEQKEAPTIGQADVPVVQSQLSGDEDLKNNLDCHPKMDRRKPELSRI